jgi:methylamine dehydrogenase heavy chain
MIFATCLKKALLFSAIAACPVALQAQSTDDLKPEEPYTQKLLPPQPQWAYVRGGFGAGGVRIFDGATGKMRGTIETAQYADVALDPAGKFYYVSETMWAMGNRGTRQDVISVYDTIDNKLQAEITLPGRMIMGGQKNNFVLSDDGASAYVYNYDPASSVTFVDLVKRKTVKAIELPGCASLMPNPVGFSALCSDGSIATVATAGAKPKITRSKPFFSATGDPIFDNFAYDKSKKQATFITYTGLIYQAVMGAEPQISEPFSIQEAAGVRRGDMKPLDVNWLPGGRELMAVHKPSGHLYVLMHKGEVWTHKEAGEEIWDVDLATHKVVKRRPLKQEGASNIEVTQDATPLLFVNDKDGTVYVLDAKTMEEKRKIEKAGPGMILTADVGTPAAPATGN